MKYPLLFICPLTAALTGCTRPSSVATPNTAAEPTALTVATQAAISQPMPRYLRITGEMRGEQQSQVAADAAGKVMLTPVERGSVVRLGDLLLKLDERNATLASAKFKLDWQRSEMARNEPLAKTKAIADSDFQKLKLELSAAEATHAASVARRDMAQKALTDTSILAPYSGTVAERLSNVGEYVSANTPVVDLVAASVKAASAAAVSLRCSAWMPRS